MRLTDKRGFTLIEILIAVTVISLLLTTVFGVFSSVSATKERLEKEGERHHLARVIFDRLGRELRGVLQTAGDPQDRFLAENGNGLPTLEFVTTTDTPYGETRVGLSMVRYRLVGDEEETGYRLLRSERPLFAADREFSDEYHIIDGIMALQLRYHNGSDWQSEWSRTVTTLPRMVEATLTLGTENDATVFRTAFELTR